MGDQIIKNVEFDLDGKVVKLTVEQAQKLQAALNELFGLNLYLYPRQWRWPYNPATWTSPGSGNNTLQLNVS